MQVFHAFKLSQGKCLIETKNDGMIIHALP